MSFRTRGARLSGFGTVAVDAGVVAILVLLAVASGTMDSLNTTLVVMGFDPDRAQLISSLLIAGAGAAAATLASGRIRRAALFGLVAFAALFGQTFASETYNALSATGATGSFDPVGWLLTVLTLVTSGVITGWAGAAMAASVRPGLVVAGSAVRDSVMSRRPNRRRMGLPLAVVAVLILLVVTVPVFSDMVNYTPDLRMLHGAALLVGPSAANATSSATSTPTTDSTPAADSPSSAVPTPAAPSPSASGSTARTANPSAADGGSSHQPAGSPAASTPWLAWKPTGRGTVTTYQLPAPWKTGASTAGIAVYTPPGYDPQGNRRYPVLYEAPTGFAFWDSATNVKVALDTLIDDGSIPAMIVVFIDSSGSPFPDTECANSVDGRMWMDTYISQTVVSYVDSHFLTIGSAASTAITGLSQGGYCAAILTLRHPSVFGSAIAISGYYQAGGAGANSAAPFGGNAAALSAASPNVVAAQLPVSVRDALFLIVIAERGQTFYGPEAAGFEKVLAAQGYPYIAQNSAYPHGWTQVRQEFPLALERWADHLVSMGVL